MGCGKNYLEVDVLQPGEQIETGFALHLNVKKYHIRTMFGNCGNAFVDVLTQRFNLYIAAKVLEQNTEAFPASKLVIDNNNSLTSKPK